MTLSHPDFFHWLKIRLIQEPGCQLTKPSNKLVVFIVRIILKIGRKIEMQFWDFLVFEVKSKFKKLRINSDIIFLNKRYSFCKPVYKLYQYCVFLGHILGDINMILMITRSSLLDFFAERKHMERKHTVVIWGHPMNIVFSIRLWW